MTLTLSIADVERDTGLSKDTLRVWERRYGFPRPQRDALGERSYALAQVQKLQVIKRLMDGGHRPGRLVSRTMAELRALSEAGRASPGAASASPAAADGSRHDEIEALLERVRRHDAPGLLQGLAVAEARRGLRALVVDVVAPLTVRIGEAWIRGELRIFEEHLFTECVQTALHAALRGLPAVHGEPRVLLATMPGEPHALGLLMAQTVLALEGCTCLSLGVQMPIDDIADAARDWRADAVALSVTGCMKRNLVLTSLALLRARLPAPTGLWVGGAAPALHRRRLDGVVRLPTLESIADALLAWRAAAAAEGRGANASASA